MSPFALWLRVLRLRLGLSFWSLMLFVVNLLTITLVGGYQCELADGVVCHPEANCKG